MSLADFFDRIGNNFATNFDNAGPQGLASLGAAIASAPRNQWGAGIANGLAQFRQIGDANKKKMALSEALKGAMGGFSPEQQAFMSALEPDQQANILGSQLFKTPAEKWEQVDSNGDGVPDRQRSTLSGKVDDIPLSLADRKSLAAAGASSTVINNIPAEMGSRIGLGEGFLREFDSVKQRAQKFYGSKSVQDQVLRRGQIAFNTGLGGELWRDVEIGKEALVRQLTGSGMPAAEAKDQARRYSISWDDTEYDAMSKIDGLRDALINTATGAYKGKGGAYKPPPGGGAASDNSDVDAILGLK